MNKFYPSIKSSIYIFLILLGFTIVLGIPFALLPKYFSAFDENIAAALGYAFPMLATIFVVHSRIKKQQEDKRVLNFSFGGWKKYIFIVPITLMMMLWIDLFASLIPMPEWAVKLFEEAFNLSIPNIIMISILAPLLEEILVRGLVLKGYLENYTPNKAIIASAVFFGAIHMNPWQFIAGFISGLFLGYLYYKTKSLIPSMFVHFMNNSLSVVFSFYFTNADASFVDMLGGDIYYGLLLVSLPVGYFLFKKLNKILDIDAMHRVSV